MHEFSIANQAADKIIKVALDKGAKKIYSAEILIGELNFVGEEQFIFWIKERLNSMGEIASDVKIDLKPVAAVIKCKHCGYEGNIREKDKEHYHHMLPCPSCNQADIEIKKGRECILNRVELET